MSEKIGFIGLGRMGLPMSYNLLRAGYDLTVHNRSQEKVRQIADAGATAATSTAEVMERCDIVLACLPDVADLRISAARRRRARCPTPGRARSSSITARSARQHPRRARLSRKNEAQCSWMRPSAAAPKGPPTAP